MSIDPAISANLLYIDRLGTFGNSGDETDYHYQGSVPRYNILKLPWRSDPATNYLRALDVLHISTRFTKTGRKKRGAFPHVRVNNRRFVDNDADPVAGLPRNFYDSVWLAGLTPEDLIALNIDDTAVVDLSIPASVQP